MFVEVNPQACRQKMILAFVNEFNLRVKKTGCNEEKRMCKNVFLKEGFSPLEISEQNMSHDSKGEKLDETAEDWKKKNLFRDVQVSAGVSLSHLYRLPVYLSQVRTACNVLLWKTTK